jgi:F0F1-type ATP synthase membrane subunit b/b'
MTEQDLLKLKQKIDDAKQQSSELKGQQTALMKQLKDDWKCSSIEEAEKLMEKMDKEIKTLNEKIETGLEELEVYYAGKQA